MRVTARDTDGLLFALETGEDVSRVIDVLGRFRSLSADGRSPFWTVVSEHEGHPLWGAVGGSKRYVLFTRNDDGSLRAIVKFTEHALAGAVADPPRLAGRGPDGKHLWARAVAEIVAEHEVQSKGVPLACLLQAHWDDPVGPPFPALMRLQAATPEHLRELAPRLSLKPFGLYVRANADPAFDNPGSFVGLDPGTDLSGWTHIDWRDERGRLASITTIPGEPGHVVTTLSGKALRWTRPQRKQAPAPVLVVWRRRAGRAGPAIDARLLDPEEDPNALRVFYDDESATGLQRLALEVGPKQFASMTELSPWAARRFARTGKPTGSMIRRALKGVGVATVEVRTCRCGRVLQRPNAQACSAPCRQRAYRDRLGDLS
jgi:hypothetical protein